MHLAHPFSYQSLKLMLAYANEQQDVLVKINVYVMSYSNAMTHRLIILTDFQLLAHQISVYLTKVYAIFIS